MSLGIAFKGAEGLVLAADSRVTLSGQQQRGGQTVLIPASFDNATKLLLFSEPHDYVAAVTYGLGALGQTQPRTAQSFMTEFHTHLESQHGDTRQKVATYANALGEFFMQQWTGSNMPPAEDWQGPGMTFLVAGFDEEDVYGEVYELTVPNDLTPKQWYEKDGEFGIVFGGQNQIAQRLLNGFEDGLIREIANHIDLTDEQTQNLRDALRDKFSSGIPYQFLPLQDCVDLAITLIRTTTSLQQWMIDVRGVGGPIDVATITRTKGVQPIQFKSIHGEST